jgi:transposase
MHPKEKQGAFSVFQGAFPKKQGAFCDFQGAFLKKQGAFWMACSGKLFLDTEGVIFVQQMYNERHENTYVVQTCPQARQEAAMKYTLEERLEIGRRIYDGEISRYEAAEQFGINDQTARNYMRMYRDANQLPPKQGKRAGSTLLLKNDHAGIDDLAAMTKEELIHELIKARITEARLKKGYEVKGDGTVVLYDSKNTK